MKICWFEDVDVFGENKIKRRNYEDKVSEEERNQKIH